MISLRCSHTPTHTLYERLDQNRQTLTCTNTDKHTEETNRHTATHPHTLYMRGWTDIHLHKYRQTHTCTQIQTDTYLHKYRHRHTELDRHRLKCRHRQANQKDTHMDAFKFLISFQSSRSQRWKWWPSQSKRILSNPTGALNKSIQSFVNNSSPTMTTCANISKQSTFIQAGFEQKQNQIWKIIKSLLFLHLPLVWILVTPSNREATQGENKKIYKSAENTKHDWKMVLNLMG